MSPIVIGILLAVIGLLAFGTYKAPRLMSVLVWALIATTFLTAALLLALPGPFSEKALFMTVAVPLVW
ncbi:MAG: hypothetical protein AAGB16_02190, partial [Pseudomonadota bacterium]